VGNIETWNQAEKSLQSVLSEKGLDYQVNEGDGAFYGPKIDFHILDSLGRSWQCGTVQLDFLMPEKFDCMYIGEDNKPHRPVMIHRAIYGSVERFMAVLIEHYEGQFPLWLAPVQLKLLPIAPPHVEYAYKVKHELELKGYRVEVDDRVEKIGLKIREAEMLKVPYMAVIGDKEVENESLAMRKHGKKNIGTVSVEEAAVNLNKEKNSNRVY